MIIAERFLSGVVRDYGKYPVSTGKGISYFMPCHFLELDHHIHSFLAKKEKHS